ncbi:MAG: DUF378 domain-containing protein [Parachlamydiaceae bacterium]
MKILGIITAILLLIGGLNWGLVGVFGFNLVEFLFGHFPIVAKAIYSSVGLSAIYQMFQWKECQNRLK